jgi:hypothetical protein
VNHNVPWNQEDLQAILNLQLALVAACRAQPAHIAIPALATTLATLVAHTTRGLDGLEAFANIFREELSDVWLAEQDAVRAD